MHRAASDNHPFGSSVHLSKEAEKYGYYASAAAAVLFTFARGRHRSNYWWWHRYYQRCEFRFSQLLFVRPSADLRSVQLAVVFSNF